MICAIVLAAGQSRRMGTQKLLLPVAGQPLIVRIIDVLLGSSVERVFVVIGRDGQRITEALKERRVDFVTNPQLESEMLGSVRCGLRALPNACDAVVLALGDQPAINTEIISKLIQSHQASGRGIVVPVYNGKRGHPLLFATRYRDELLTRYDGTGLRGLLQAHPDEVLEMETPSSDILEDMDSPADYDRIRTRYSD